VVAESIEEGRQSKAEGKEQEVDMAAATAEAKAASASLAGEDSVVEPATEPKEAAEGAEKPASTE
jgi:hypothetical protein